MSSASAGNEPPGLGIATFQAGVADSRTKRLDPSAKQSQEQFLSPLPTRRAVMRRFTVLVLNILFCLLPTLGWGQSVPIGPEAEGVPIEGPGTSGSSGGTAIRLNFTKFNPDPAVRRYPFASLAFDLNEPHGPVLELAIEGRSAKRCVQSPCGPSRLGLTMRYFGDPTRPISECGASIRFPERMGLGESVRPKLVVVWSHGALSIQTADGQRDFSLERLALNRLVIPMAGGSTVEAFQRQGGGASRLVLFLAAVRSPLDPCP
jgi:hypothetical protein